MPGSRGAPRPTWSGGSLPRPPGRPRPATARAVPVPGVIFAQAPAISTAAPRAPSAFSPPRTDGSNALPSAAPPGGGWHGHALLRDHAYRPQHGHPTSGDHATPGRVTRRTSAALARQACRGLTAGAVGVPPRNDSASMTKLNTHGGKGRRASSACSTPDAPAVQPGGDQGRPRRCYLAGVRLEHVQVQVGPLGQFTRPWQGKPAVA